MFGLVDVSHTPSLGMMRVVPDRTAATLLPLIQQHVAPGTIIHSDMWSSYRRVAALPNVAAHRTVNHSIQFVTPAGVHTQNIESYWNRVKTKLKRRYLNIFGSSGMNGTSDFPAQEAWADNITS